mmetsp:Transcript_14075/g.16475  ORF Transcript_14075/g.16475 Transcript_14075/m.16475 type:complete len:325 (+) Transcript_14075:94-1068(+)
MNSARPRDTKRENDLVPLQLLVAGGVAGSVAKTVVAPLERIRIMAQTGHAHKTTIGTARAILEHEGVVGLWRGNFVNCCRVFPSRGILFACNDLYKSLFAKLYLGQPVVVRGRAVYNADGTLSNFGSLPTWLSFASGSVSGMTASASTYPLDVARTRISGQLRTSSQNGGLVRTLIQMGRKEGPGAYFKGIGPTLLGSIPYEGIKFLCFDLYYDAFRKNIKSGNESTDGILAKLISGALAGATAGFAVYPNDTVRRLLQMDASDSRAGKGRKYSSAIDCWVKTYRHGGIERFYRGLLPYILRMAPNSAVQFGMYETLKQSILSQ